MNNEDIYNKEKKANKNTKTQLLLLLLSQLAVHFLFVHHTKLSNNCKDDWTVWIVGGLPCVDRVAFCAKCSNNKGEKAVRTVELFHFFKERNAVAYDKSQGDVPNAWIHMWPEGKKLVSFFNNPSTCSK